MMPVGQKIKMYYDPRGNVIRTVNPDASEQWVIHGKPNTLDSVAINNSWSFKSYSPTPWESYSYDANDLATKTNGTSFGHDFTPGNSIVDPLGRTVKTISRLTQNEGDEVVMKYTYDIQGNPLTTIDALNRIVFEHKYGLAKQLLWKNHLDSGESTTVADATGKPIEATDAKGAKVFTCYDAISRPQKVWAKDNSTENIALRQVSVYAESLGLTAAANLNLLGKIYQHYDEAGLAQIESCDFKGNPLEKFKQVISDDELLNAGTTAYTVDWTGLNTAILDATEYRTTVEYDALNRGIKLQLPADINSHRAEIEPVFNKAGALEQIKKDGIEYVTRIAYNAKGQQLLAAWNNDVMMRFTYHKKTFRLKRVKAEKYTIDTNNPNQYNYNSGTSRYDQQYVYDLVGNIVTVNDATPDCGIQNNTDTLQRLFEYDSLYRLIYAKGREDNSVNNLYWQDPTQATLPNANNCRIYEQDYEYNKVGNLQNLIHTTSGNNFTRHYSYQTGNNKLNSIDDGQVTTLASFTYGNTGNQITANSERNYEWNYADRMRCFYIQAGMTISKFAHYMYDAGGARTKKLVINQQGDYESVTYIDGVFEYHKRVSNNGATTEEKNYIQIQGGIEIRTGEYADDDNETTLYTISDYLSSATIRLKPNAAVYDKEEFHPYGESSLRTFGKKRYRFTGKERDNESGLYYMNARYYCSGTGKFLSVDPLAGKYAHQSSYCYADCNPVMLNDPSGMGPEDPKKEKPASTGIGNKTTSNTNAQNTNYVWSSTTPLGSYTVGETDGKTRNTSADQPVNVIQPKPKQEAQKPKDNLANFTPQPGPQLRQDSRTSTEKQVGQDIATQKKIQANEQLRHDLDPVANEIGGSPAVQGALAVAIPEYGMALSSTTFLSGYANDNKFDMFMGGLGIVASSYAALKTPTIGPSPVAAEPQTTEKFYRGMSKQDYETFVSTGKVPSSGETFVSPTLEFAENYAKNTGEVLVEFNLKMGTTMQLESIGVTNIASGSRFASLPAEASGWGTTNAFFKLETNAEGLRQVNIGLGSGKALNIFNSNITSYKAFIR